MTNKNVNARTGLNSIWTDSIANNQQPDNKALLAHLKTVHQNNACLLYTSPSPRDRTIRSRVALANTYYRDGAKVVNAPTMVSGDWQKFMPNVKPGEVAASPLNPICWPVKDKL